MMIAILASAPTDDNVIISVRCYDVVCHLITLFTSRTMTAEITMMIAILACTLMYDNVLIVSVRCCYDVCCFKNPFTPRTITNDNYNDSYSSTHTN